MKILIIAPKHGGINVYVDYLVSEFKKRGEKVDWIGSEPKDFPYSIEKDDWQSGEWVEQKMECLLKDFDLGHYDVILYHFGKNDIEQLAPSIVNKRKIKPKQVYFVHYLSWLLFKKYIPNEKYYERVIESLKYDFDGYFFYSEQAKNDFYGLLDAEKRIDEVSFLPETHSKLMLTDEIKVKLDKKYDLLDEQVIILGYGSAYKDYHTLLDSLDKVDQKIDIKIIGKGWLKRVGKNRIKKNKVSLEVYDEEVLPNEFGYLVSRSLFGIFLYKDPNDEFEEKMQGSGTLSNYLFYGKPCIYYANGSIAEMVNGAGIEVSEGDSIELARVMNSLLDKHKREEYEQKTVEIKDKFSIEKHTGNILNLIFKLNKNEENHIS